MNDLYPLAYADPILILALVLCAALAWALLKRILGRNQDSEGESGRRSPHCTEEAAPMVRPPPSRVPVKYYHWMDLSTREKHLAVLIAEGKSNEAIASELGISSRAVETHLANILNKLAVKSRFELIRVTLEIARYEEDA